MSLQNKSTCVSGKRDSRVERAIDRTLRNRVQKKQRDEVADLSHVWKWISVSLKIPHEKLMIQQWFGHDAFRWIYKLNGLFLVSATSKGTLGIHTLPDRCFRQNRPHTIVFSKTEACSWLSREAKCFWSSSLVFDGCRPEKHVNPGLKYTADQTSLILDTYSRCIFLGYVGYWGWMVLPSYIV